MAHVIRRADEVLVEDARSGSSRAAIRRSRAHRAAAVVTGCARNWDRPDRTCRFGTPDARRGRARGGVMQESQGAGTGCGAAGRALPAIARGVATAGGVRCDLRQFSRPARRWDGFRCTSASGTGCSGILSTGALGLAIRRSASVTFDEFRGVRLLAAHVRGGSLPAHEQTGHEPRGSRGRGRADTHRHEALTAIGAAPVQMPIPVTGALAKSVLDRGDGATGGRAGAQNYGEVAKVPTSTPRRACRETSNSIFVLAMNPAVRRRTGGPERSSTRTPASSSRSTSARCSTGRRLRRSSSRAGERRVRHAVGRVRALAEGVLSRSSPVDRRGGRERRERQGALTTTRRPS